MRFIVVKASEAYNREISDKPPCSGAKKMDIPKRELAKYFVESAAVPQSTGKPINRKETWIVDIKNLDDLNKLIKETKCGDLVYSNNVLPSRFSDYNFLEGFNSEDLINYGLIIIYDDYIE